VLHKPSAHDVHAGCAGAAWYWPAAHAAHAVLPTPGWEAPAAQSRHCTCSLVLGRALSPDLPTPQTLQNVALIASWYLPPGHAVQLGAFSDAEYCPASHFSHTRLRRRVPGLQSPQ
jgi:hypothetical protein